MQGLSTVFKHSGVVNLIVNNTREYFESNGRRWQRGNTLASDASGLGSTPGQGTLEDDLSFYPTRVGKLSTSFVWEGGGRVHIVVRRWS